MPLEDGRIPCILVPQADDLDRVIEMVTHIANGRSDLTRPPGRDPRDYAYYLAACRSLGFVEDGETATITGEALARFSDEKDEKIMRVAHAFEASEVGKAWLAWSGCKTLEQLKPETARRFLDERVHFPTEDATTKPRRAACLSKWCWEFTRYRQQHDGLLKQEPRPIPRIDDLPRIRLERGGARKMIETYAPQASKTAVITAYFTVEGYLVLAHSLRHIDLRLLIGSNEQGRADVREITKAFEDSVEQLLVQDHPSKRRAVRELRRSLVRGTIKPRHFDPRERHGLHAKVYIFDRYAALLGSANLTGGGMDRNIENIDVTREPEEIDMLLEIFERYYEAAHVLAEPFIVAIEKSWAIQEGTPYEVFLKVLHALFGPPAGPIPRESPRLAAFQEPIVNLVCARLQELRGVLLVAPTGAGKTVMAAHVATRLARGPVSRIVVVCKNELMERKWNVAPGDRERILNRFAPNAQRAHEPKPEKDIQILIATDAVGESEDLQDARSIINYDLPWTPLKLIQRIGRLDRATTERRIVRVWNFFPRAEIYEELLGHWRRLENRDQENAELTGASVIGERRRVGESARTRDARNWSGALLEQMQEPGAIRALQREASPPTSWVLDALVSAPLEIWERVHSLPKGVLTCRPGSRPGLYVLFWLEGRKRALFRDERTGERLSAPDASPHDTLLRYIAADPQTPKLPVPEEMGEDVGELLRTWAKDARFSPDDIEVIAAVRIVPS